MRLVDVHCDLWVRTDDRLARETQYAVHPLLHSCEGQATDQEQEQDPQADSAHLSPECLARAGNLVGVAVETFSNKGFGPLITVMVGLLPDGLIYDIAVISHQESPGLGDKMEKRKSDFSEQFKGKDPAILKLSVTKDGGDVDAITAATISSRGYCDAVRRAYEIYLKEYGT